MAKDGKAVPMSHAEQQDTIARLRRMFQYVAVVNSGDTLTAVTYNDTTKAEVEADLRQKAKRTGYPVEWPDGSREFYRTETVFNGTGESGGYIWKGDKVKVRRTRICTTPDGQRDEQVIWEGFMDFDKATGD